MNKLHKKQLKKNFNYFTVITKRTHHSCLHQCSHSCERKTSTRRKPTCLTWSHMLKPSIKTWIAALKAESITPHWKPRSQISPNLNFKNFWSHEVLFPQQSFNVQSNYSTSSRLFCTMLKGEQEWIWLSFKWPLS